MAKNKDSIQYTVKVALLLCIVCSVVVSSASVLLKPMQEANRAEDFRRNILSAAGLLEPGKDVQVLFSRVQTRIVDLRTGRFSDAVDPASYNQRKASGDPSMSERLPPRENFAKVGRREHFAEVYMATNNAGEQILILPVRGAGLWGTIYGFVALADDFNTVVGLGFYEHKETPGLGAEIDNPNWQAQWEGKRIFDAQGQVAFEVIKGRVDANTPSADYKVDGLSGATLTSRGVDNLINFWFGENGYKPFLQNLKRGEA